MLNVSRSGFYEYLNRKPSKRKIENDILRDEIKNIIEEHKILIKRLEEDIHTYQRKAKELDDIINLFILTEQGPKGR